MHREVQTEPRPLVSCQHFQRANVSIISFTWFHMSTTDRHAKRSIAISL